jgi:hypothetical protein
VTATYHCDSGDENILRLGENLPIQIIILQPFFEESSRFRQILVATMRALATHGIGTLMPDLPGTGESLVGTSQITIDRWRRAILSLKTSEKFTLSASFRGAALIDDAAGANHLWRFAPETGQRLVRDLRRTQLTSASEDAPEGFETVAGNVVQTAFLDALAGLSPAPAARVRTVRLEIDAAEADAKVPGTAVWRRSEPGDDPALRAALINDIREWAITCAAS